MAIFSAAVDPLIFELEGGDVNDPDDPGGHTKYGISKAAYPGVDIANLTIPGAQEIYLRDWWQKYEYKRIDDQRIANRVFWFAVNNRPKNAHRALQRALRAAGVAVKEDGILGPQTFYAVNHRCNNDVLLAALRSEIAAFYRLFTLARRLKQVPRPGKYLKGWLNRAYK